jgi:hypothetical protein
MRRLSTFVLAAMAVLGAPLAAHAQIAASAKAAPPTLVGCQWTEIGRLPGIVPRALAFGRDGALLIAADDVANGAHPSLVILRQAVAGAAWERVDTYLPNGALSTGARALHVDDDGNVFALGWRVDDDQSRLVLRRSFGAGVAGTWESAETDWPLSAGGALSSDAEGRIYVAHDAALAGGIGWRVESALRGIGAFAVDDEVTFAGTRTAMPHDFERTADGALVVAAQLDGEPDEWVVRSRGRGGVWRTIDRYQLAADAYGLAPRAIVPIAGNRLLVAGLGVRGGSHDDYLWIERSQNSRGRWRTAAYQLQPGATSVAQDAATTPAGVAVLGVGYTSGAANLILRESTDGGARWQTALQVSGVGDPWSARLAVASSSAAVTASIQGSAVVLGCRR